MRDAPVGMVFGVGGSLTAFPCRCNTQDYTWHKGTRCEAIVTDFQVMCVAVGSAALVVLLLFMLTVFFAKKLYLLKTENSKLRKTKYRTPSELHNDNFSLSTIAEGSHPNTMLPGCGGTGAGPSAGSGREKRRALPSASRRRSVGPSSLCRSPELIFFPGFQPPLAAVVSAAARPTLAGGSWPQLAPRCGEDEPWD
ncbi:chondroitin sulfate proteoglycan 5 isoform X2 [Athene cunicularia]|uniref:chondroitin sulfate proteoglycan 5 isoform X2 n=1 Tax=Athene cunicularia TaxID=194338 RepID=UPI000EF6B8CB|nr:chondroitin sulfate proteoglycan 5 isoform X2 [Athene cunicularia]